MAFFVGRSSVKKNYYTKEYGRFLDSVNSIKKIDSLIKSGKFTSSISKFQAGSDTVYIYVSF